MSLCDLGARRVYLTVALCMTASGCSQEPINQPAALDHPGVTHTLKRVDLKAAIVQEAAARDKEIVDGWYFGEEPRLFKSSYAKQSAETKAQFAEDYHAWLELLGENLEADWHSYVPYAKRASFARSWWQKNQPEFDKENKKMQVVFLHEALMDGNELWWRSMEKLAGNQVGSAQVLAHDEEQRMVSNYTEDGGQRGSLSTQPR